MLGIQVGRGKCGSPSEIYGFLGNVGQMTNKGNGLPQDTVHPGQCVCRGWGDIRNRILKEVAPEVTVERDACLASNISKVRHSRQRKEDERRCLRNCRCLRMTGPLVPADKCEKRNREGAVYNGETHSPS